MPELPKIVTRKLAEREPRPSASHPDADLLTAFVEQVLPERDRGAVLGHLADCSSCREIVALSLPYEADTTTVLARKPARPSLFFLRWGALAACAIFAISAALLYKRGPDEAPMLARNQISQSAPEAKPTPTANAITSLAVADVGADKQIANKAQANAADSAQLPPPTAAGPSRESESGLVPKEHDDAGAVRADSKAKHGPVPVAPAPSPSNDAARLAHEGVAAKDAMVAGYVAPKSLDLPTNGRSVTELLQLKPGVVAATPAAGVGASAGAALPATSALDLAPDLAPDPAKVTRDQAAKKDETAVAFRRSPAAPTDSVEVRAESNSAARSKTALGVVSGAKSASVSPAGEVRGQVVDASGAAVSGAQVTITNTATGASLASSTNNAGVYDVPSVPAGPYSIAISAPGFQQFVRPGVNVEPALIALNATLQVGAVSQTVEVAAQAPSVDTTSAAVSSKTAFGSNDKDSLRASSAQLANLPGLVAARPAGTWQLTGAGNLRRSFDGGKSWESVSVDTPGRLRVVAATGFQVWAGGNGGLLLHSQDAGGHFAIVKVHKKHSTLTGDIVTLMFADARHGRLETVSHEVWTTSDGGKSWRPSASVK